MQVERSEVAVDWHSRSNKHAGRRTRASTPLAEALVLLVTSTSTTWYCCCCYCHSQGTAGATSSLADGHAQVNPKPYTLNPKQARCQTDTRKYDRSKNFEANRYDMAIGFAVAKASVVRERGARMRKSDFIALR